MERAQIISSDYGGLADSGKIGVKYSRGCGIRGQGVSVSSGED